MWSSECLRDRVGGVLRVPPALDCIADGEPVEIGECADAPGQVALVDPVGRGLRGLGILDLIREMADEQVVDDTAVEDVPQEIPLRPTEAHLAEGAGELGVVAADIAGYDRAGGVAG